LGADPDPKFPVQKMQGKHEKLGRGGDVFFFGGGGHFFGGGGKMWDLQFLLSYFGFVFKLFCIKTA
jgi:hypothetical protein